MKIIMARDWKPGTQAYLWEETGNGALRLVTGIRRDYWIVTGYNSWCCCEDTRLYLCTDEAERAANEAELRRILSERRRTWNSWREVTA